MCELFVNADSRLWEVVSKELNILGSKVTVSLEVLTWSVLGSIAERDNITLDGMLNKLYIEALDAGLEPSCFTSFLRVCALRYSMLMVEGLVSKNTSEPLYEIEDVDAILNTPWSDTFTTKKPLLVLKRGA